MWIWCTSGWGLWPCLLHVPDGVHQREFFRPCALYRSGCWKTKKQHHRRAVGSEHPWVMHWVWPPPSNSGIFRWFIGIPYRACNNNHGGHCYWEGPVHTQAIRHSYEHFFNISRWQGKERALDTTKKFLNHILAKISKPHFGQPKSDWDFVSSLLMVWWTRTKISGLWSTTKGLYSSLATRNGRIRSSKNLWWEVQAPELMGVLLSSERWLGMGGD